MKNIVKNLLLLAVVVTTVASCYKEEEFWADSPDIQILNSGVPSVFLNTLDSTTGYWRGSRARMNLEYWAKDNSVDSIIIYATVNSTAVPTAANVVERLKYAPAFSQIKQADTLLYVYNVPTTATIGSTVRLNAEVVTKLGARRATWTTGNVSTRSFTVK